MAPRRPESQAEFLKRLLKDAPSAPGPLRFGTPHATHAVCHEGEAWRIRRLELDPAKAKAYLEEHGCFMPEHAELISEPGAEVVLGAPSLEALVAAIKQVPWPLR